MLRVMVMMLDAAMALEALLRFGDRPPPWPLCCASPSCSAIVRALLAHCHCLLHDEIVNGLSNDFTFRSPM